MEHFPDDILLTSRIDLIFRWFQNKVLVCGGLWCCLCDLWDLWVAHVTKIFTKQSSSWYWSDQSGILWFLKIEHILCQKWSCNIIGESKKHFYGINTHLPHFASLQQRKMRSKTWFPGFKFSKMSIRTICRRSCERRQDASILREEDLLVMNFQKLLELSKNIHSARL